MNLLENIKGEKCYSMQVLSEYFKHYSPWSSLRNTDTVLVWENQS